MADSAAAARGRGGAATLERILRLGGAPAAGGAVTFWRLVATLDDELLGIGTLCDAMQILG